MDCSPHSCWEWVCENLDDFDKFALIGDLFEHMQNENWKERVVERFWKDVNGR